jgi:O-antigen/teichoic acid export membrane protein
MALWGTPLMVMYYIGPLLAFRIFHSLIAPILLILILRLAGTYFFWRLSVSAMPGLVKAPISLAALKPVLRLSGWMMVPNMVWPILNYFDRLAIASFVSAAATGYYSTPGDVITRLALIPISISTSAFPAIAASQNTCGANTCRVIRRSFLAAISAVLPVSLVLLLFGDVLLRLWLGRDFAAHSAQTFRWFSLGLIFLSANSITAGAIEALGHPEINAKFSIVELVVFVPTLAIAVKTLGLPGAAEIWCLRATVDFCLLLGILHRLLPQLRSSQTPMIVGATSAGVLGALCFIPASIPSKAIELVASLISYFAVLWLFALNEDKLPIRQGLIRIFYFPAKRLLDCIQTTS